MLQYTGHPIADIGVATVTAFCRKTRPEDITEEDCDRVAEYLLEKYVSGILTPYLSCVFTMNAPYTQPSWDKRRRQREAREVLFAHRLHNAKATGLRCAFSGEPASRIAYRQHVPMLTGENVLNFFPAGSGGLPISGKYLLAVQAFPLGARRCHGRALAVHSVDDPELTYAFARRFLADNRKLLLLAKQSDEKYADAKAPKSLVIHVLQEIENERRDRGERDKAPSVTVYHLTNSGQGPDIDIFHLPSEIVGFLRAASRATTAQVWQRIQGVAWEKISAGGRQKRGKKQRRDRKATDDQSAPESLVSGPEISRNYLYEDLFALPGNAAPFVRTYFLRRAYRSAREGDPGREYRLGKELDLVSWELTRLFLKEVIGMDKKRIDAIRALGDRIAEQIKSDNDRRLFQRLYRVNRYGEFRNLLIKASAARVKKEQAPIVGFEEFLVVFEEGDEMPRIDWTLARDLVLIRVIEQLHQQGWFRTSPELLEELDTEEVASVAES